MKTLQKGFTLIELMIVIAIIGILVGVGIPAWQASVRAANEAAAVKHLSEIANAQATYYNTKNRTGYGTFDQLVSGAYLKDNFTGDSPVVDGYVFTMKVTPRAANQPPQWGVNANPEQPTGITATGSQFFYFGSDVSTIRTNPQKPATPDDPPIGGGGAQTK